MATPATWHVTSQVIQTELSDAGTGFIPVWQVSYVVDSGPAKGTTGRVNVPASVYSADTVKEAITEAVYHLDAVAGL